MSNQVYHCLACGHETVLGFKAGQREVLHGAILRSPGICVEAWSILCGRCLATQVGHEVVVYHRPLSFFLWATSDNNTSPLNPAILVRREYEKLCHDLHRAAVKWEGRDRKRHQQTVWRMRLSSRPQTAVA